MLNIEEKLLKNIENKSGDVLISISEESDFDKLKEELNKLNILLVKSEKSQYSKVYELYNKDEKIEKFKDITIFILRGDVYKHYYKEICDNYILWYAINKDTYTKNFIENTLKKLNREGTKVVYDLTNEFKNKRVVLDINEEIEGYNLVFKDEDLEMIKYEDIDEIIKYFTEEELIKRIFDDEFKQYEGKIENLYLFSMPKLVTLKDKLNNCY